MYGDGIDRESSGSYRKKKKDSFQSELQRKLSDRRTKGLTTDITSPEEDSEASGEDDFLSQFITPKKRDDRPKSAAKHRTPPSFLKNQRNTERKPGLGDTMRPGAGGDIFGRYMSKDNYDDSDEDGSDLTLTVGSTKSPRLQEINTKNHPKQGEKLSKEDIIFGRKGSSPRDSKSPRQETNKDKLPWQPPSFKKTQLPDADTGYRAPSPGSSKGRKTPTMDPLLESISETPTPRSRQLTQSNERYRSEEERDQYNRPKPKPRGRKEDDDFEVRAGSPEFRTRDRRPSEGVHGRKSPANTSTGRKTPVEGRKTPVEGRKTPVEGRKTPTIASRKSIIDTGRRSPSGSERKSPTSDIFGKSGKSSALDFLESEKEEELREEKKTPKVTPRRMSTKTDSKSRAKSPVPAGRKTPIQNKKEAGKKTKSRSSSPENDEDINTRRASVMDFMLGDSSEQKPRPRKSRLSRANSSDSITDELDPVVKEKGRRSRSQSRGSPKLRRDPSNSSICEDIQGEPLSVNKDQDPDQPISITNSSSGPQRSDKQQAEDAINFVAGAQDKLGMSYIEPDKEKKTKKKSGPKFLATQRPKPRYPSKPGEIIDIESPGSFEDTVSIRNAIFVEWYKERSKKTKEAMIERKKMETEEEAKKRKDSENKVLENKASYNAWMERKQSAGKGKFKEKREEELKKEHENEEKEKKKKDALKTFNTWKERKDSITKTKVYKVKDEEKDKEREETKKKRDKQKQNSTAYKSWKERKDNQIHSTIKTEKKKVEQETMSESQLRKHKEREAEQRYELWMRKKEEHDKLEKRRERQRKLEGDEFRPAWSPANKTIPFGR